MTMQTLYYVPNACSLAAHIALEWCDASYEAIATNFGDQILYDLNPIGTVGILQRDNDAATLTQTPAILRYIARRYPDANIGDDGSLDGAAEIDSWLSFLVSDVHHAFHLLFIPERYAIEDNQAAREAALSLCCRNFGVLDKHLTDRAFMLGERRSILDAYIFPMIRWSKIKFPQERQSFGRLNDLHDRLIADDGVQRAMRAEGILEAA